MGGLSLGGCAGLDACLDDGPSAIGYFTMGAFHRQKPDWLCDAVCSVLCYFYSSKL